ncbi:hypothetical protein I316_07967 [Kwoniella heveanensis BCC8398]|uniref:Uncharacterized protein n=1 Tax=Kwoniella heveanensis BCC8398 TaxID=1296120 RepID=A0A1B9GH74_9TREE|nr:hypothetical protein I316_07967 [Kwoniella heveanensis BCC8398]
MVNLLAPLRSVVRVQRGPTLLARGLHASSPALRKGSSKAAEEDAFEAEEEQEEEDLFAESPSSSSNPSSGSSSAKLDKAAIRAKNVSAILNQSKLNVKAYEQWRKQTKAHAQKGETSKTLQYKPKNNRISVQALRQVVACTEEADQLNELKSIIRACRAGRLQITKKTASEIVGRCINLGKPQLASELISNHSQYGLPAIDQPTLIKLHHALSASSPSSSQSLSSPKLPSTQPISPTLSLLRLQLLQKQPNATTTPEAELKKAKYSPKARSFKESKQVQEWVEEAKKELVAAGGAWAGAVKQVEARV